jgi:hypothetical protein
LEKSDAPLVADVNIEDFGPPEYEGSGWKFSIPQDELKNATVLLKNHDKPILAQWPLGSGTVTWSGMNLPFHFVRFNKLEESKIIINFIKDGVALNEHHVQGDQVQFVFPGKVEITPAPNATAVLFKQELWPGWKAWDAHGNLPIYAAGPTYYGFMYVPIKNPGEKITIAYEGEWKSILQLMISICVSVLLIIEFVSNGYISKILFNRLGTHINFKVGKWWAKEDEE